MSTKIDSLANKPTFYVSAKQACVDHQTDAPVVAIKYRERGFYPIFTRASADDLNHSRYTPEELEAAIIGSMFSWEAPGASAAVAAAEKELTK